MRLRVLISFVILSSIIGAGFSTTTTASYYHSDYQLDKFAFLGSIPNIGDSFGLDINILTAVHYTSTEIVYNDITSLKLKIGQDDGSGDFASIWISKTYASESDTNGGLFYASNEGSWTGEYGTYFNRLFRFYDTFDVLKYEDNRQINMRISFEAFIYGNTLVASDSKVFSIQPSMSEDGDSTQIFGLTQTEFLIVAILLVVLITAIVGAVIYSSRGKKGMPPQNLQPPSNYPPPPTNP